MQTQIRLDSLGRKIPDKFSYSHPLYKVWTIEEENKLRELSGTMGFKEMAKQFPGRTANSLQSHAIFMGLSSDYQYHKWTFDVDFWKTIDPLRLYYAGFCLSDGSLVKYQNANGYMFSLQLNVKDIGVLEGFKEACKYTGPIPVYKRLKPIKENGCSEMAHLVINVGTKWVDDLKNNFGMIPNKTYCYTPPNITDKMLAGCLLRGFTDGDGCLSVSKGIPKFSIVSSNIATLEWIKDYVLSNFKGIRKTNKKIGKCSQANAYLLAFDGYIVCEMFDYLKSLPVPNLARKWDNPEFIKCVEMHKEKAKDIFSKRDFKLALINNPPNPSTPHSR